MSELVDMLDATAEACRTAEVPTADAEAVVVAAMRLGYEVLGLAQRIVEASHEHDPDCRCCAIEASAKHPPHDPKPPASPKPPADPNPGK